MEVSGWMQPKTNWLFTFHWGSLCGLDGGNWTFVECKLTSCNCNKRSLVLRVNFMNFLTWERGHVLRALHNPVKWDPCLTFWHVSTTRKINFSTLILRCFLNNTYSSYCLKIIIYLKNIEFTCLWYFLMQVCSGQQKLWHLLVDLVSLHMHFVW